jgi:hypothetical protein
MVGIFHGGWKKKDKERAAIHGVSFFYPQLLTGY